MAKEDQPKLPHPEQKREEETISKGENIKTEEEEIKKERDGKTKAKEKGLRPESPFHSRCRPKEPSRQFVAKPIPANLLTTGSPVKARVNGKHFMTPAAVRTSNVLIVQKNTPIIDLGKLG